MPKASVAFASAAVAFLLTMAPAQAADGARDPMRFFIGTTESVSTIKVMMTKPYRSKAIGKGKLRPDGSVELIQRVERAGHAAKSRHWIIRRISPGHFTGTMSDAVGPVTIDEVGGNYRFRFKMKGNLSVEEWLNPKPDWQSATERMTVRRFGIKVGSSEGYIRKID